MVFTALKLRATAGLTNPTVLIVVDRIDLDTQITGTFNASDVPNLVSTDSRQELQNLLSAGARKVIITTIHKFGEAPGVLDDRDNIIVMVDEAHRSQEGDYGRKMREALPNAFLFGLTGTPINRRDRNTFMWFGSEEDEGGYLSRYSNADAIRDGATLPLHFEPRLSEIHIDEEAINTAFAELAAERDLSEADKATLSRRAASLEILIKSPERIRKVAADIAEHFTEKVEPQGFKAQVVVYDKPTCVAYKEELDKYLPAEASTIVMSKDARDPQEWREWTPDRDELERIVAKFNDPADPLKIIIVTAKLLTGFDAPILYAQYLDKPLKEHTLLQAITRTNRVYPPKKTHGLIVDYLGVFDDVAKAFAFDEKSVQQAISNIAELRNQLGPGDRGGAVVLPRCRPHCRRLAGPHQAQAAIATDEAKDAFGLAYSIVSQLWEAFSPDPILQPIRGRLPVAHRRLRVGATRRCHRTVGVAHPRAQDDRTDQRARPRRSAPHRPGDHRPRRPDHRGPDERQHKDVTVEEVETAHHRPHRQAPQQPEVRRTRQAPQRAARKYAHGQQASLDFLRELFALARDTVAAEKETAEIPREDRGKAALTELFESLKDDETPIIVERVVNDVDEVVRAVRFEGWQNTHEGTGSCSRRCVRPCTSSSRSATTTSSRRHSATSASTTRNGREAHPKGPATTFRADATSNRDSVRKLLKSCIATAESTRLTPEKDHHLPDANPQPGDAYMASPRTAFNGDAHGDNARSFGVAMRNPNVAICVNRTEGGEP